MADEEEEIFGKYAPASFEVEGIAKVPFGIKSIQRTFKGDIARHRRLYKNGARLDHLGSDAIVITTTSEFYNGASDHNAPSSYPDDLNALERLCERQETGWLNTPTHGPVRAKCEAYERVEAEAERDCATFVATWVVDSEDDESVAAFQAPAASSVASTYQIDWAADAAKSGVDTDPFGEIASFCDDLSQLARAPEAFIASFEARATQTVNAIARVERAYSQAAQEGVGEVVALFTNPGASRAVMKGRRLADTLAASANSTTPFTFRRYPNIVSIFDVAADVQQDASRLIAINADLPDVLEIAPRTPVRVFAAA